MKNKYLRVGQIVRAHGVHGDVKVLPLTDDPARYRKLKTAYLERGGDYLPVALDDVRLQPDAVILHVSGYDTPEKAEQLKSAYLCVDRENAVALDEYTYFVADLIGWHLAAAGAMDMFPQTASIETAALLARR